MLDTLTFQRMPTQVAGFSRRRFLKGIAAALAGGALISIGDRVLSTAWLPLPPPISLQRSTFAGLLGQTFQVGSRPADVLMLQLIKIGSWDAAATQEVASANHEHCFSILFRGPADWPLAQATYRFEHPQLGAFPLFIVPMISDPSARHYEAIFNSPLG